MLPRKTTPSLSHQLFGALVALTAAVAVAMAVLAAWLFHAEALSDEHSQLKGECTTLATLLENTQDDATVLAGLNFGDIRATLVNPDGTVTFDSAEDAATLPNHAQRPEILAAQKTGSGSADRASTTVGYLSVYEAVRLSSGQVLRLSVDRATTLALLTQDVRVLVGSAVAIALLSWLAAHSLAARLVRPIANISMEPAAHAPYTELKPMVERLNTQHTQLAQQVDALRDAAQSRREFTANVTHELKTPIAAISGAAELLRAGMVPPEQTATFAARIYEDAQRLSALVTDILTLSKLDEAERVGNSDLFAHERFDLATIAQAVHTRLAPSAAEKNVNFTLTTQPALIQGSPKLAEALIANLCENAIRYNKPSGMVELIVSTAPRPIRIPDPSSSSERVSHDATGQSQQVTLVVRDTGIGIPPEDQTKVFERFYRVDKGRSREMGGTGLGLAIVKHAAINLGATLHLESTPGQGTTITVIFP